jgi:ABC-type glycerol-3-phosphate transport system permease component
MKSYRLSHILSNLAAYVVLTAFALVMLFPFLYMFATSLKTPGDTYNYPPRLLPREQKYTTVASFDDEKPLYFVQYAGEKQAFALVQAGVPAGVYARPEDLEITYSIPLELVIRSAGAAQEASLPNGEVAPLYDVPVNGDLLSMVQVGSTALGRFIDPDDPGKVAFQVVRTSEPVTRVTAHPENYTHVMTMENMARSLTNTTLITIFVVLGQMTTSVLGGYAFARLRFPGRDILFVFYLGTIMIPFVMLIIPLYQLMVLFGWTDKLASLIFPWVFTAYGTFLMRQFFITIPKEIEEAALIDGASRLTILRRIFLPAAAPALATLATFTFLYAWNSFFWPLVIINTGNYENHVLTLTLNMLRGRASDSANLILAGAAISILPPFLLFIFGQRFFIESAMSSGVKG